MANCAGVARVDEHRYIMISVDEAIGTRAVMCGGWMGRSSGRNNGSLQPVSPLVAGLEGTSQ